MSTDTKSPKTRIINDLHKRAEFTLTNPLRTKFTKDEVHKRRGPKGRGPVRARTTKERRPRKRGIPKGEGPYRGRSVKGEDPPAQSSQSVKSTEDKVHQRTKSTKDEACKGKGPRRTGFTEDEVDEGLSLQSMKSTKDGNLSLSED